MLKPAAMLAVLIASVALTSRGCCKGKYLAVKILSCALMSCGLYFVFYFLDLDSFSVPLALGQLCCLTVDLIIDNRLGIFPSLCLFPCIDCAFVPLERGEDEVWSYGIYLALLFLCVVLTFPADKEKPALPTDFYPEKKNLYLYTSAVPCLFLIPEVLILVLFGNAVSDFFEAMGMCCIFLIFLCLGLLLRRETTLRLKSEELCDAMNRWQYESRDYMNTIRSQRHDFNLHLHAISGLINSGEYEKCSEYAGKLVSEANDVNDIMPVTDAVVGSMLYNMREEARRKGTDIVYNITYDMEDILCNGFECNKIIGNLLQNAIDALNTEEDKKQGIKLSIFKRRGNTVIISENRFSGDPDRIAKAFEAGFSTKKGHEGIGLSMVLRTVKSYGGRIYPEFDGDLIRFVVNIPNKVSLLAGREAE